MSGHPERRAFLAAACAVLMLALAPAADAAIMGQWNIDEGSGTTVGAAVGSIDGTFVNAGGLVAWVPDGPPTTTLPGGAEITPSNSLSFDLNAGNSNDYVQMLDPTGVLSPASATVAFWLKALDTSFDNAGKIVLSKWSDTAGFSWEFGFGNGLGGNTTNLFLRVMPTVGSQQFVGAAGDGFTPADLNDGKWHQVVGTYDGAVTNLARLYVDGEFMGEAPVTGSLASTAAPMLIGQRPYSDPYRAPFKGQIGGALLVLDSALSAAEVASLGGFEYIPPDWKLGGRWDLNAAAGGVTPKVLGSQDGVIHGNVTLAAGGPPATYLPDGTVVANDNHFVCGGQIGDNIDLGNGEELSPDNITVAFWTQTTASNVGKVLVSKHGNSGSSWEFAVGNDTKLFFRTFTAGGQAFVGDTAADPFTNAELSDGEWHFIVGTHDGTASALYVDGELVESLARAGALNDTTGMTHLMLGQRPYNGAEAPYSGSIGGPVLVFNYAMDADAVRALSVPEPSTFALLAVLSVCGTLIWRRTNA
jgi:hypothetical protein